MTKLSDLIMISGLAIKRKPLIRFPRQRLTNKAMLGEPFESKLHRPLGLGGGY